MAGSPGPGPAGHSAFGAQALVVSLGLDTFEGDPISGFGLNSADYLFVGEDLARAGLPVTSSVVPSTLSAAPWRTRWLRDTRPKAYQASKPMPRMAW